MRSWFILPFSFLVALAACADDETPPPPTGTAPSGSGGATTAATGGSGGTTQGVGGGQGGSDPVIHGCTKATAVDRTAMGAFTLDDWTFGHQQCVIVSVDTEVTWDTSSSFTTHPLVGGERPAVDDNSPITIAAEGVNGSTAMSVPVTFLTPGTYPYHCENHTDMNGVIYVE